jgi:hypothetical protein
MTSHVTRSRLPQSETETAEFGIFRMRYSNLHILESEDALMALDDHRLADISTTSSRSARTLYRSLMNLRSSS